MNRLLALVVALSSAVLPAAEPSFARVAKATSPPPLHKNLAFTGGWLEGAAFGGMVDYFGQSYQNWSDAAWFVTYDDDFLYVGCQVRSGDDYTGFVYQVAENDDSRIVFDDHLEIQVSFVERDRAGSAPFPKIMVNPRGAVWAGVVNWLPGQNKMGWAERVRAVCHVDRYMGQFWWVTKLAIPLAFLEQQSLDGRRAIVQLVYSTAGQHSYAGWRGETWMSWDRFGEMLFDPQAPSFILDKFPGALTHGRDMHVQATVTPRAGAPATDVTLAVANTVAGEVLYEQRLEKTVKRTETATFRIDDRAEFAAEGNALSLELRAADQLLYRSVLAYRQDNPVLAARREAWAKAHRLQLKAQPQVDFAHFPSFHCLQVRLDATQDVVIMPAEEQEKAAALNAAVAYRVSVLAAAGKVVASHTGELLEHRGTAMLEFAKPLPEGQYVLRTEVLGDGAVVGVVEHPFVREVFPWEGNTIGLEKVVIPPYRPLAVQGTAIRTRLQAYTVAPNGLFATAAAEGRELLSGPMELVSRQADGEHTFAASRPVSIENVAGRAFPPEFDQYWYRATCPAPTLQPTDGYQARVTAAGTLGGLDVQVAATMEYEGWYDVVLTLAPRGEVACDSLDLVVPFTEQATMMRFHRAYDTSGYGRIPAGEGVVFDSGRLQPNPMLPATFVPRVYVGNYSRGLWWAADSDEGWVVDDTVPEVQLERQDGIVRLRLRLVNAPARLTAPRRIHFTFQAVPMKPVAPNHRRIAWKYPEPLFAHDTSGLRYYGNSLNSLALYTDADYAGLKDFYYDMPHRTGEEYQWQDNTLKWWGMAWLEPARRGHPLVEYGSTWVAGAGMREAPTFRGEWSYSSLPPRGLPEVYRRGQLNYGGTYRWTTDAQLSQLTTTANRSYQDFLVWHMSRIAAKAAINGTFYDNWNDVVGHGQIVPTTDVAGDACRRADGRLQIVCGVTRRHALTKRLATALWLLGRPPFQLVAWEPDISFVDASWFVEGIWYHHSATLDLCEQGVGPELFQASTCKPGQLGYLNTHVPQLSDESGKPAGTNVRSARLVLAYCLLNDLGCVLYPLRYPPAAGILDRLQEQVRFLDDAAFVGYWEPHGAPTRDHGDLLVSAYRHPQGSRAVLVILNPTDATCPADLTVAGELLGRQPKAATDLETGQPLALTTGRLAGGKLGRHDFRLVVVE